MIALGKRRRREEVSHGEHGEHGEKIMMNDE